MVEFVKVQDRQRIVEAMPRVQVDLPPPSIDEAVEGVISLDQLGKGLTVRISFFEGQQVGARFHIIAETEGSNNGWGIGGTIETSDGDTLVPIPADRALAFRGQRITLYYFYLDAEPPTSPSASYFAEDEIYRPVVDEAEGRVIPLAAVNNGVHLRLRASEALSNGSLVSVYWVGTACEACLVRHLRIEADDDGKDVVLPIEPRYLRPNKYGTVQLIYTVENAGRKWISSLVELGVEGDLLIPKPVYGIEGGYSLGELHPIDENGRIPMKLSTRGMSVGDAVTFIFVGDRLDTSYVLRQTLAPHQIGHDLLIGVPIRFDQLGGSAKAMSIVERVTGDIIGSPILELAVME
ncbi:hypothetical protein [Pseudomonas farris]